MYICSIFTRPVLLLKFSTRWLAKVHKYVEGLPFWVQPLKLASPFTASHTFRQMLMAKLIHDQFVLDAAMFIITHPGHDAKAISYIFSYGYFRI